MSYEQRPPVNNGHSSFGVPRWSLYTGLTLLTESSKKKNIFVLKFVLYVNDVLKIKSVQFIYFQFSVRLNINPELIKSMSCIDFYVYALFSFYEILSNLLDTQFVLRESRLLKKIKNTNFWKALSYVGTKLQIKKSACNAVVPNRGSATHKAAYWIFWFHVAFLVKVYSHWDVSKYRLYSRISRIQFLDTLFKNSPM